jgi:hypothetical protein
LISEELLKMFQNYQKIKRASVSRSIIKTWQKRYVQKESSEPQQDWTIILILKDDWNEKSYSLKFKDGDPISPVRIEWSLYIVRFHNWEIIIWW